MSTHASHVPTVLAVDDSEVVHEILRQALEPECCVLEAKTAVDALSMIYQHSVDIVLLDVLMPGVDGFEFCRTLRSLPQLQNLPVVMVTSKDTAFDRVQGRLAGATEYLTKPFNPENLRQTIRALTMCQASGETCDPSEGHELEA